MKRRTIISALMAVVLVVVCATTALAESARPNFTWLEATAPRYYSDTFTFGDSGQITYEGVATSPQSGTFRAELQKKNFLGIWVQLSNLYTVSQHSNQTYNLRTSQYVTGQYFKLYWPSQGSGTYRVVLSNPSNPQATVFTQVYY